MLLITAHGLLLWTTLALNIAAQQSSPPPTSNQQSQWQHQPPNLNPIPPSVSGRSPNQYNYGFDANLLVQRQASQPIVVGRLSSLYANGSAATTPIRREIREMRSDPIRWNLFLLGMSMFQWTDQNREDSWYQIAGIHGRPFQPWNGVLSVPGGEGTGYCPHTSVLFPTWHRPYLALVEQILYDKVNRIAAWFVDPVERLAYQQAAAEFRVPYWDWALSPPHGEDVFLPEFTEPTILVYGPNGWQYIANPLYSYHFRPIDTSAFVHVGLNVWNETKRAPTDNFSPGATSQNSLVVQALNQALPSLQQRLFNLFSNYPRFLTFGSKQWNRFTNQSDADFDSIEGLHDVIHMLVGQRGHLTYTSYSAFDPMFFLHHYATDRIIALWQILYPDSWVEAMPTLEATFTTAYGQVVDGTTPLTPFRIDALGNFWTSDMSRTTLNFGYAYQDMILSSSGNLTEQRQRVSARINELYGTYSPSRLPQQLQRRRGLSRRRGSLFSTRNTVKPTARTPYDLDGRPNLTLGWSDSNANTRSVVVDHHYKEWLINVHVDNDALGGSFNIHFFFGSVPEQPTKWPMSPNLVGSISIFAMLSSPSMVMSKNLVSGTTPLTSALMQMVESHQISSLNAADVEPFLKQNLNFRIVSGYGAVVDPRSVNGLSISVASALVEASGIDTQLPKWGETVRMFEVFGES